MEERFLHRCYRGVRVGRSNKLETRDCLKPKHYTHAAVLVKGTKKQVKFTKNDHTRIRTSDPWLRGPTRYP
eukprot:705927-Amphidinium_carterae.1